MNIAKQIVIVMAIALFPSFLFSQNKNADFKYEQLSEGKNVDAKFLENYNNGIKYYNEALNIIYSADNVTDMGKLEEAQKKSIEQFKIALPYFENAYKINPKDENTLMGLSGIYFGLNDMKKSDKYRKELEAVRKK